MNREVLVIWCHILPDATAEPDLKSKGLGSTNLVESWG